MTNPLIMRASYNKRPIQLLGDGGVDPDKLTRELGNVEQALRGPVNFSGIVFNPLDFKADPTGARDSSRAWNQMLRAIRDAGGGEVVASGYWKISEPLTTYSLTTVTGVGVCEFRQQDNTLPVFDCVDADDVLIRTLTCLGQFTRFWPSSGSFRGDNPYNYNVGVWANGSRVNVYQVTVNNFIGGIYYSPWDTATEAFSEDGHEDSAAVALRVLNVDQGVLYAGTKRLTLSRIHGTAITDTTLGVNPSHLLYATGNASLRNYDTQVTTARCQDHADGGAYQFKHTDRITASDLMADDGDGLINLIDVQTGDFWGLQGTNQSDQGGVGAVSVQDSVSFPASTRIRMECTVSMAADQNRAITFGANLSQLDAVVHSNHTAPNGNYQTHLKGEESHFRVEQIQQGSSYARGIHLRDATASGLTTVNSVVDFRVRGESLWVNIDAAVDSCQLRYDPSTCSFGASTVADIDFNGATNITVVHGTQPLRSTATATTATASDSTILVDATGGARTVTLTPASEGFGRTVTVKKVDASVNAVTVDGDGGETIDGAANYPLPAQYDAVTVQSDGTAWHVIASYP